MRYSLRTLLIVLAVSPLVLASACWVIPFVIPIVPPHAMTWSAMGETFVRIHMYMRAHRKVPADLSVLPKREGYANRTADGWRRNLIYAVSDDGIISLTSLGRDGKIGGQRTNADVTRRFRTRNNDGSLNIDDEFWIVTSEIRDDVKLQ